MSSTGKNEVVGCADVSVRTIQEGLQKKLGLPSRFFDFRASLKNIFSLEPHMKLATFVVGSFYHNNKKVKCYKIVRRRRNQRRRKKGIKTSNFLKYILSALEIAKAHISRFFWIIGQLNYKL